MGHGGRQEQRVVINQPYYDHRGDGILPPVKQNVEFVASAPYVPVVIIIQVINVHEDADSQCGASGSRRAGGSPYSAADAGRDDTVSYGPQFATSEFTIVSLNLITLPMAGRC
jgi:hypothetical protein